MTKQNGRDWVQTPLNIYESIKGNSILELKSNKQTHDSPLETGRKVNVHNTSKRRLQRLLNVTCKFNLRPVSREEMSIEKNRWIAQ